MQRIQLYQMLTTPAILILAVAIAFWRWYGSRNGRDLRYACTYAGFVAGMVVQAGLIALDWTVGWGPGLAGILWVPIVLIGASTLVGVFVGRWLERRVSRPQTSAPEQDYADPET